MTLVLVPHHASQDRASVWAAVSGSAVRPGSILLTADQGQSVTGRSEDWKVIDVGGDLPDEYRTTWTQTLELTGLTPGRRHLVRGVVDSVEAFCRPGTLPDVLPPKGQAPYVVLLASCFASFKDKHGAAGASVAGLRAEYRPHLKLLCGDQVYLDNPWYEILPRTRAGLAQRFLDKYLATWMPSGGHTGLAQLLAEGSTYFLADDHEFWNNHPNWGPLVASRLEGQRQDWSDVAQALYETFQAAPGQNVKKTQQLQLGPLEVRVVDTRFGREAGDTDFMDEDEHAELVAWLRGGTAPAVVVLGAPLFTKPAGWFSSRFADRSLANYEQYAGLADALLASQRPILVLTGDVHFGRYATAKDDFASRAKLVEIAASPLALVDSAVGGTFQKAPDRFPVESKKGAPHSNVRTWQWNDWREPESGLAANHFVTLSLNAHGRGASIRATAWKIAGDPASPSGAVAVGWQEFTLEEVV
jgi:hypothetical protein